MPRINIVKAILMMLLTLTPFLLQAQELKARLGVEVRSGGTSRAARARDRARPGDQLVAYVLPSQACHFYAVLHHGGKARLISPAASLARDTAEAFPGLDAGFAVPQGQGAVEITLIVASAPLPELAALTNPVSADEWKKIEKRLREQEHMRDSSGKPVPVAANVRAVGAEAFARQLPVYSGNKLMSARFVLEVQNRN